MKGYLLTPAAEDDLFDIWATIATDNAEAADQIETEIFDACARLAVRPDLGHFRRDLTDRDVRFFVIQRIYLIVYHCDRDLLHVLRVLHGARDVASELL